MAGEGREATHFEVYRKQGKGRGQGMIQSPRISSNDLPLSFRPHFLQFQHLSKVYPVSKTTDGLCHEGLSPHYMCV